MGVSSNFHSSPRDNTKIATTNYSHSRHNSYLDDNSKTTATNDKNNNRYTSPPNSSSKQKTSSYYATAGFEDSHASVQTPK